MKKHIVYFVSLFVLCSVVACGGGGGDDSSESVDGSRACGLAGLETRIINGQTCQATDAAIVRVAALVSLDGIIAQVPICTGTMISNNDVLTAQHCFEPTALDGAPILGYGIIIGEVEGNQFIPAERISLMPGYDFRSGRLFNDAAILHLATNPGLPVIGILVRTAPSPGDTGFVYGYGRRSEGTEVNSSIDFSTLEAGAMEIDNITNDHVFVIYTGSGTNVCNGDSGGPIIVNVDGTPAIVGVVSQGTTVGCVPDDITSFTNMQNASIMSWLAAVVPDAAIL